MPDQQDNDHSKDRREQNRKNNSYYPDKCPDTGNEFDITAANANFTGQLPISKGYQVKEQEATRTTEKGLQEGDIVGRMKCCQQSEQDKR